MILSIAQVQSYLKQAGWPASLIPTAAAVFMFESGGGDTTAHNGGNPPGAEDSWGLAQVNRKAWPQYSVTQLLNPLFNLQVAWMIYQKQGWRAWTNTYYGGRYQQYMAASNAAWNGTSSSGTPYVPDTTPDDNSLNLSTEALIGIFIFGLGAILFLKSVSD